MGCEHCNDKGKIETDNNGPIVDCPVCQCSVERVVKRDGYDKLWSWFGCSRASWLTMPRVMMHEMPDEWQSKMAELLEEWDETWDTHDMPDPHVTAKKGNKFTKWPSWLLNYRRPDKRAINSLKRDGT